ncbi:MAG: pyrroloquinoline quinone-dependent dehydrogenase [Chloroflexota bacterium]|nr:pyrroloquinoline quinone-dependent dehydrogenase [Chloroflexota bacterium]
MVDGTLFLSTPTNRVIALDARTGTEQWVFDPKIDRGLNYSELTSRGVSIWTDPVKALGEAGYRRLLLGTIDGRLLALDAETGLPVIGFGDAGTVDLTQGVGTVEPGQYNITSPPAVTADLVIVGSAIGDNRAVELERGIVRAYDVRSGELRWSWDPIPREPDDPGYETWNGPVAHKTGGANAWPPLSVDLERDLVFVPTSSPSPDYYGGERLGQNLYANSVVALRASTGEPVWHFQTVHHDLWDYDVPMQPLLFSLDRDGEPVPAVAIGTKQGHLFVMHRETGEALFEVEERPVPQSTVPGEESWPTQPFPAELPLFGLREVAPDEAWGMTEEARAASQEQISAFRSEGLFTPPSLEGTIQAPGNLGGFNWGGLSYDPARGLLVGATNRFAAVVTLVPRDDEAGEEERQEVAFEIGQQLGTPYRMERSAFVASDPQVPYTPPPWGTLAAVDLTTGTLAWEVPLGISIDPALVPEAVNWGAVNLGGPTTTASGLVFIAATLDGFFRAFDIETGEIVWQVELPAGGQATPMTYAVDGRQFVAIAAGGHGKFGIELGEHLVAYALPVAD